MKSGQSWGMWGAATGLWRGWRSKWGSVDVDEELEGCGERVVEEAAAVGCAAAGDVKVGRLWCGDAGNSANDDSESSFRRSLPHLEEEEGGRGEENRGGGGGGGKGIGGGGIGGGGGEGRRRFLL